MAVHNRISPILDPRYYIIILDFERISKAIGFTMTFFIFVYIFSNTRGVSK